MKPFKPHKLPIKDLDWDKFLEHIGEANRAVAKFDGYMQSIPKARILLSPLTTKEAVLSSKIEGTQASLEDVLKYEASPNKKTDKYEDIQEVLNYRKAMNMAIDKLDELPLSARLIKENHKVLMQDARGSDKTPGEFRTGPVYIGNPALGLDHASHVPPEANEIEDLFADFERYIHYDEKDYLVQLAIIHAQFEIIHPFWDGNGRTGRILMPLFLYYKKVLKQPMLYLSEYFETNRDEYYQRLKAITKDNDWESWILFFLVAVIKQSEKNILKVEEVLNLYNSLKEEIVTIPTPKNAIKVLDFLFSMPIFNSPDMTKETGIQRMTALRILKYLEEVKVLSKSDTTKVNSYRFNKLVKILE
ncbi:Fic family protein [Candidatus Nomurabacteria bacterium]|uniref:Fic family protein n=2 Tax=Bacteria candidate phyla TaxID=1783234 RepID=A0A955LV79_UNCKA|nr:Fic family protein [Candidatus Dojkabacteria bacterium]MCA9397200.1 Fic family protein [candidate division WWE3 bacterium]MCB9789997.1 Fic family protein [Candidatus Nomurabacteria bacterium]MCB9803415.1 Fic family protein [Candidatus Nomurabacteria bacterium]